MAPPREGRVVVRGGADLTKYRPVFSADSKYIFVCSGYIVKIFSAISGECVRELKGHDGEVTGVTINTTNKLQVFTSSLDGTINQWDYADGILLKTLYVKSPIMGLFVHQDIPGVLFATTYDDKSEKKNRMKLVKITVPKVAGQCVDVEDRYVMGNVSAGDKAIAFGPKAAFVAAITDSMLKILFWENMQLKILSPDRTPLTCVACHPVDYCIAVGNEKGHISIWRNFNHKEIRAREHWHSLRVEDVCYSPEGSTLYSVGHECTLVEWQHESLSKIFLPRQGAPISHIVCAPNSQMRALSLMTNAILIQSHQKTHQTIQGLVYSNFNQKRDGYLPAGLVIDPRTRALVTNGMVGQLQFYQLEEDRLLFSLDITGENYISPENLRQPLMHTEVEKVTFDLNGDWMATVERRDDKQTSPEMRLKFWEFDKSKQSFVLNTIISEPHTARIHALSFRPHPPGSHNDYEPMVVTASDDGKFKLWTLMDDDDGQKKSQTWCCDSVSYFRDEYPKSVCFSSDGSLLAVAFGHIVTLWDPDINVLKKTLCHGPEKRAVEYLVFGHGSAAHCLVSASSSSLNVWNLLSYTVTWQVNMELDYLVGDTVSEYVAAFDGEGCLFSFHPSEPKLVYSQDDLPKQNIINAVFIPRTRLASASHSSSLLPWEGNSMLYFITKDLMLLTVTGEKEGLLANRRFSHVDLEERIPQTPFAMLLNNQLHKHREEEQGVRMQDLPASANMREMLQSPAHVLPPIKSLCGTFLQGLLDPRRKEAVHRKTTGYSDDSDDDSEKKSSSEDSDMELDGNNQSNHSKSFNDQSQDAKTSGEKSELLRKNATEDSDLSEADCKRLAKMSRSGLKWMRKVFQDTY